MFYAYGVKHKSLAELIANLIKKFFKKTFTKVFVKPDPKSFSYNCFIYTTKNNISQVILMSSKKRGVLWNRGGINGYPPALNCGQ
jgi:hypothetical protein